MKISSRFFLIIKHLYNKIVIYLQPQISNTMKWNELRKIAESYGWRLQRAGANHDIYRHPDKKEPLVISRHGSEEIKNGTFAKLRKQIGF